MTEGGWITPYAYKDAEKEAILAVLRPHLLPDYTGRENELIDEVARTVNPIVECECPHERFTGKKLTEMVKLHQEFSLLLDQIDDEAISWMEMQLMENKSRLEWFKAMSQDLGIPYDNTPLLRKAIFHVVDVGNFILDAMADIHDRNIAHRPADTGKRSAIFRLYALYQKVTGKPIAIGGTLQRFIETAMKPAWQLPHSGVSSYLKEMARLDKTPSN